MPRAQQGSPAAQKAKRIGYGGGPVPFGMPAFREVIEKREGQRFAASSSPNGHTNGAQASGSGPTHTNGTLVTISTTASDITASSPVNASGGTAGLEEGDTTAARPNDLIGIPDPETMSDKLRAANMAAIKASGSTGTSDGAHSGSTARSSGEPQRVNGEDHGRHAGNGASAPTGGQDSVARHRGKGNAASSDSATIHLTITIGEAGNAVTGKPGNRHYGTPIQITVNGVKIPPALRSGGHINGRTAPSVTARDGHDAHARPAISEITNGARNLKGGDASSNNRPARLLVSAWPIGPNDGINRGSRLRFYEYRS